MPTKQDVENVLKGVVDPEIGVDIFTLEMIYEIRVEEGKVYIKMTLTTPMCPYGPMIIEEVKEKTSQIEGVKDVEVEITFDPPWQPSEQLRATLGI